MAAGDRLDDFLAFSAVLTGFSAFRLRGTGQTGPYLETIEEVVGGPTLEALLAAFREVRAAAGEDEAALDRQLRREILSDPRWGPLTRNLIKLWYVGIWYELPADWREAYGENDRDRTFVVSADAYTEGLLWPAIGANPSGAKPHGYGMWALPPRIETP